ncbi:MAG: hypothetical protein ABIC04_03670 [Nanoarchaeota archaeon]
MEEEKKSHGTHEHKVEHHEKHEHHKDGVIKIKKGDLWKSATTILAILLLISIYFNVKGPGEAPVDIGTALSSDEVADNAIEYINTNLMQPGTSATLVSVTEKDNLYNIKLDIGGREFDSYATKNGKLLFPSSVDMTAEVEPPAEAPVEAPAGIVKSDKPVVELFVMSHCPYGTQAEKGIIPVAELLGDKVDLEIKFVNYAMHGEKEVREQLRQHCIKTEQSDLFFPYLKCFLKDGNSASCLDNIDMDMLSACEEAGDKEFRITETLADKSTWSGGSFPPFLIDNEKNLEYGVRGSPTLIINGNSVNSARSPAAYLVTICEAFNEAPEECETELSAATPAPGFGYEDSGTDTAASCG